MSVFAVYLLLDPRRFFLPFYIGKGKSGRAFEHLMSCYDKYDPNRLKRAVIAKIRSAGLEPLVQIWASDLTEDEAFDLEKKLISRFGRRDIQTGILTNLTDGGEGMAGRIFSEETRRKIGASRRGRSFSAAHRAALSTAAKARRNRVISPETREKIGRSQRGRKNSIETRQKMSVAAKARIRKPHSEETRQKIAVAKTGKPTALRGHIVSNETRGRISIALTGKKRGPLTSEHKEKLSVSLRGKAKPSFTNEHRKKIGDAGRGRVVSEETRSRLRTAQLARRKREKNETL